MTKEEIDKIEEKFKIVEMFHSTRLNGELKYDSDKIALYTAFKAMDEYAKQESIGFHEWVVEYKTELYSKCKDNKDEYKRIKNLTTEELYNIYLNQKGK